MATTLHFLDWNRPVTERVCEYLLEGQGEGPVDLSDTLIVVPTRQANRRLREALALACGDRGTGLLSPRVVQPLSFLRADEDGTRVANDATVRAVWMRILRAVEAAEFPGLFPQGVAQADFAWALYTGQTIQRLRDLLVDGGLMIRDVTLQFGASLEEPERWQDLMKLEERYLVQLHKMELEDPCLSMLKRAENPVRPPKIKRMVLAAVPDPTPLTIKAMEKLGEDLDIEILVHAPASERDHFDEWGRPDEKAWTERIIEIPEPEKNLLLAGSPSGQSRLVLDRIAEEADRFGPLDLAIGTPDTDVVPVLAAELEAHRIPAFDPAGRAVESHALYHLMDALQGLMQTGAYHAVSRLLRHPDVLHRLQRVDGLSPAEILSVLDTFQNERLPSGLEDFPAEGVLGRAAEFLREQVARFDELPFESAVEEFLQDVYRNHMLSRQRSEDEVFMAVARIVREAIASMRELDHPDMALSAAERLTLLAGRLADLHFYPDNPKAVIDLEGWLELPWNDAPFLLVTGMNEGFVPDGQVQDVFLPDRMRRRLGIRHDAQRFARDAYLMQGLIESRREDGRVCFLVGKTSRSGDPLKPSRLLFRCADEDLPGRVRWLFDEPVEPRFNDPVTVSFKLDPDPPDDLPADALALTRISVTRFRAYLTCPFGYYLDAVLNMAPVSDDKTQLDDLEFGILVHFALQAMGRDPVMRASDRADEIADFLDAQAASWVRERYGDRPPLPVVIQLESARQRLRKAAEVQAGEVRAGWELIEVEQKGRLEIDGVQVSGKIDRIDRHRDDGRIRILDYKTSDAPKRPVEQHLGPVREDTPPYAVVTVKDKPRAWTDLQLPLYRGMLDDPADRIEVGYFDLPKAVSETGITAWGDLDEGMAESARVCAAGVIEAIREKRFWPPRAVPRDFERVLPGPAFDYSEAPNV